MGYACGNQVPRRGASRRGFTLVELLVVISVMSLLISISMPSFQRARLVSKRTNCMANLRSIGQAMGAYLTMHDEYCPYAAEYPILPADRSAYCDSECTDEDCCLPPIYEALDLEIGHQRKVFQCPADKIRTPPEDRPNRGTWFASLGSSYEWDKLFNGKRVDQTVYARPTHVVVDRGLGWHPSQTVMMFDYEAFHGGEDEIGSVVYLYADLHVSIDKYEEPDTLPGP